MPRLEPLKWPEPPSERPSYIGWHARDLSRRTSFPIVADCYPAMEAETVARFFRPPWPPPAYDGKTAVAALNEIQFPTGYEWRVEGEWLLLRYGQWFWEAARPEPGRER
jgi:hypothetical protein